MSAGLPLIIVNILSIFIITLWVFNGSGGLKTRAIIGIVFLISLLVCWYFVVTFGVFHDFGSLAMSLAFLVSIVSFFIPVVSNKHYANKNS